MKEIKIKHNNQIKVFKVSPKLFEELNLNDKHKSDLGDKLTQMMADIPDDVSLHSIVWDY